jgi:hypothetical protein
VRSSSRVVFALRLLLATALPGASAAQSPVAPDRTVDAAERRAAIEGILTLLNQRYVFPDTALAMAEAIRERQRRGDYDGIGSGRVFAESLTTHLQAVSKDRHLRVTHSVSVIPMPSPSGVPTPEQQARAIAMGRQVNFGFERVERLDGNVGYLELRSFGFSPAQVADAAAAAFTFLGHVDAMIIDVRRNGGGSPYTVGAVSSYLFGPERVHLNSLFFRPANSTQDFHTQAEVRGTRFGPDKPLYVLTSRRTFSAAEEFTYNLQTRKRAVVVGDTTGGGAHPGGNARATDHFNVWIPSGRAINPITGTNWERVGVRPDIAVSSEQALHIAHLTALRTLRDAATDPERRESLDAVIARVEAANR